MLSETHTLACKHFWGGVVPPPLPTAWGRRGWRRGGHAHDTGQGKWARGAELLLIPRAAKERRRDGPLSFTTAVAVLHGQLTLCSAPLPRALGPPLRDWHAAT